MDGLIDATKSNLTKIVSISAPILAAALGSPIAGILVSLLANTFQVSSTKIADITSAISSDPSAAFKLRSLELAHLETLNKIASKDYEIEVSDRINARSNSVLYKDFLRHLAYLVTFGFFGVIILIMLPIELSDEGKTILSMLVGMLVSKWQTIIDFFYGSSRSKQGGLK